MLLPTNWVPGICSGGLNLPERGAQCRHNNSFHNNGNNKCFKFCGDTTYATYAVDNCRTQGGHLASIHSLEEQNFLAQTFNPGSGYLWIGAVDTDHSCKFVSVLKRIVQMRMAQYMEGSPKYWTDPSPERLRPAIYFC